MIGDVQVWETIAAVVSDRADAAEDANSMTDQEKQTIIEFSRRMIHQVNRGGQTDIAPTTPRRLTRP